MSHCRGPVCLCQAFCADFAKLSQPAILRPLSACCIIKQRDIAPGCEAGLLRYQKGGAFLESIQRYWKRTDKVYLLLCLFSSGMAVLALASWAAKQGNGFAVDGLTGQITGVGDYRRAMVQAGAAAIGIVVAILLSNIDYRSLVNVWPVHVALTWGLVLPTLVIRNVSIGPLTIGYNAGDTDNYSWYKLGGFTFQPTELAKISFILTFAMHLNNVRSRLNEPKELGKLLLHLFVPIAIIHIQGDDGTAIIYGIIGCCMLFAAGLSWKYIVGAASALAAAMAVAFAFFSDKIGKGYQWYRILAVIDPNNETGWAPSETVWKNIIYQQQRGEIAIGSGGIFGNGFFEGRYYSVPNAHNDFILSWMGNAIGFRLLRGAGRPAGHHHQDLRYRRRQRGYAGFLHLCGHRRRAHGPDLRQCGDEPSGPARHRCHPALLLGRRQLGAHAVYLRGSGAVGVYAQHEKAVWVTHLAKKQALVHSACFFAPLSPRKPCNTTKVVIKCSSILSIFLDFFRRSP